MVLVVIAVPFKTGTIPYSIYSATRKDQPRFKIDKTKIGSFAAIVLLVFLLSILYSLLILQNIREIETVMIFSIWNTATIAFGLSFWLLLKRGKSSKQ